MPKLTKPKKITLKVPHRIKSVAEVKHHSGKGTNARLNTVAEKNFFRSRFST